MKGYISSYSQVIKLGIGTGISELQHHEHQINNGFDGKSVIDFFISQFKTYYVSTQKNRLVRDGSYE